MLQICSNSEQQSPLHDFYGDETRSTCGVKQARPEASFRRLRSRIRVKALNIYSVALSPILPIPASNIFLGFWLVLPDL
jgi:hypothetical protein